MQIQNNITSVTSHHHHDHDGDIPSTSYMPLSFPHMSTSYIETSSTTHTRDHNDGDLHLCVLLSPSVDKCR